MKYGLDIYEDLWNIFLFASTYEEALYWGKRIIELGSEGVTIFDNCDTKIYDVVARLTSNKGE